MSDFNIYCCGGFGGNIGKQILDLDINTFFIDTSISNLKNLKHNNIFLVDNIDGAGKSRDKSFNILKNYLKIFLLNLNHQINLILLFIVFLVVQEVLLVLLLQKNLFLKI